MYSHGNQLRQLSCGSSTEVRTTAKNASKLSKIIKTGASGIEIPPFLSKIIKTGVNGIEIPPFLSKKDISGVKTAQNPPNLAEMLPLIQKAGRNAATDGQPPLMMMKSGTGSAGPAAIDAILIDGRNTDNSFSFAQKRQCHP